MWKCCNRRAPGLRLLFAEYLRVFAVKRFGFALRYDRFSRGRSYVDNGEGAKLEHYNFGKLSTRCFAATQLLLFGIGTDNLLVVEKSCA